MVLDKYFCPFSYIRDKELAQRLYGENAASLLVPGKGDNSWYVVPTYPTCGALEIKNRFTMNPETPTCGTLEEALNGNQVQPLNIFSTILAGPRKAVKSVCNSVRKAIGRRKRMTTTTSTRTDDSSPPNQLSKHRRIDNEDTPTLCISFNHGATPIVHKFPSVSNLNEDRQPPVSKNHFCTFDQAYHQQLKASLEFIKGIINDTKTEERTMQELNGLAIAILDNEKLEGSCISKIEYVNKERKACTRHYAKLQEPYSKEDAVSTLNRCKRKKSQILYDIVKLMESGGEEKVRQQHQRDLVEQHLVTSDKRMAGRSVDWDVENPMANAFEMMAIREEAGSCCSTNRLVRIFDAFASVTRKKASLVRPSQLKKQIGDIERERLLSAKCFTLEVQLDEKKSKLCVFYYIPQLPLLCERMMESSYADCS